MKVSSSQTDPNTIRCLTPEEASDPKAVVTAFFDDFSLRSCHTILGQASRDQLLSGELPDAAAADAEAAGGKALFFEKAAALLEAAYLLDRANGPEAQMVKKICSLLPVRCIIEPNGRTGRGIPSDLVVIVSAEVKSTIAECEALLTEAYARVRFTVFKSSFLTSVRDSEGNYFSEIFKNGHIRYRSDGFQVPVRTDGPSRDRVKGFSFRIGVADAFLKGARRYLADAEYRMAVFMSHQVIEHALLAALDLTMGVTHRSHHLERMVRIVGYVFPRIPQLFESREDRLMLERLESAYARARYQAAFRADALLAREVTRKAEAMISLVKHCLPEECSSTDSARGSIGEKPVDNGEYILPDPVLEEIRRFFDASEPESFKKSFFHILLAYSGEDFYRYGDPADVSFVLDNLRGLLEAIGGWIERLNVTGEIVCPGFERSEAFYPGCLSAADRADPVAVAVQFFRNYKRWPTRLDSIQFFALCRQSGIEDGECIDTLKFYHDVGRLVEVCRGFLPG